MTAASRAELAALRAFATALDPLPPGARSRILRWLAAREQEREVAAALVVWAEAMRRGQRDRLA